MKGILALVLTAVLLYLYHKIFTVVYVNALAGIIREIAVCFVLSLVILSVVFNALGIKLDSKKEDANQPPAQGQIDPAREQSDPGWDPFLWPASSQESMAVKDFYGTFFNTALLNNGVFDAFVTIGDSEEHQGELHVFGYATAEGLNYLQTFDIDIPMPEGSTFTFQDTISEIALTITLHPENHTLEIVQEPITSDGETPYTGSYVDNEVWDGLIDERRAAVERIHQLLEPSYWINDYAGCYILEAFAQGEEDAPYARFDLSIRDGSGTFLLSSENYRYAPAWFYYVIPYPMGDRGDRHFEYETNDGLIAFDVLDDKEDGRHVIQITDCPYSEYIGTFVSGAEVLNDSIGAYGKRINWPGNYFCDSGGVDGTKSISISQVNDQLLSIEMVHNYADGRVEMYHADAEINAFGNGVYYAVSDGEKWIDFMLQEDPDTGKKAVRVEQTGINLSIDPEFWGTYLREP